MTAGMTEPLIPSVMLLRLILWASDSRSDGVTDYCRAESPGETAEIPITILSAILRR